MNKTKTILPVVLVACSAGQVWALGMEDFGDEPLYEANFPHWQNIMPLLNSPTRVYHNWVNGNENVYYRGNTEALNVALKNFANVKTEIHEVFLRPGPGIAHSFHTQTEPGKTVPYNWHVHVVGGIVRYMTTLEYGETGGIKSPVLTAYIGGDIDLAKINIPKGVSVFDLAELCRRCRRLLTSHDKAVRGQFVIELARLDPYDTENLAAVTKLLKDDDARVRQSAVIALASFGKKAEPVLPALREMLSTQDTELKAQVEKTIRAIQKAADTTQAEKESRLMQEKIRVFCDTRKR